MIHNIYILLSLESILLISVLVLLVFIIVLVLTKKPKIKEYDDSKVIDTISNSASNTTLELTKQNGQIRSEISESINKSIKDDFTRISDSLSKNIQLINENLNKGFKDGFSQTNTVIDDFKQKLAILEANQKSLEELRKTMNDFNSVISSNKLVGNLGEYFLENILHAYFGEPGKLYKIQEKLGSGQVDAAICMPGFVVPIDSKFNYVAFSNFLANQNKDTEQVLKTGIKTQIDAIAKKYIIKDVTSDFVVMFVPSEQILDYIYKHDDILSHATERRVVIVSPSSLPALIYNLNMIKLDVLQNNKAKEVRKSLANLEEEFIRFKERWDKLDKNIAAISKDQHDLSVTSNKIVDRFKQIREVDLDEE